MRSEKKALPLFLVLALLLALIPGLTAPASAAEAAPLELEFRRTWGAETVQMAVKAAEAFTVSNLDLGLSWDHAAFSLTSVENAQPEKLTSFVVNTETGKLSATAKDNGNVDFAAGETLATCTFLTEAQLPAGEYAFSLTVRGAGTVNETNGAGVNLPWKGAAVTGTLLGGTQFTVSAADGGFTVRCNPLPAAGDRIIAALYAEGGQMKETVILGGAEPLNAAETVRFTQTPVEGDAARFFWLDSGLTPRFAAVNWPEQP